MSKEANGQMTDWQRPGDRRRAASDFFVAGGTLPPNVPSYVERPVDDELFELALSGEFCYILTARQMGKSSLMIRTARRLQAEGVRTVIIDLTAMGASAVDTWYLDLLTELADELDLSIDPEAWWRARASLGQVRRFVNFLRDVVLAEVEERVVIFVDEIDKTLQLDFRDDFFAAIRAMFNARASYPRFNRLTFVLLGVASPSDLIKDPALTPFNIGQGIELEEFSQTDVGVLQGGLEAVYPGQGEAIFTRIYHWTNGHPYLTQKLCLAVTETGDGHWTDERVDELVDRLFLSEEARKEANLKFVQDKVLAHPQRRKLFKLYEKVLEGKEILEDGQSPIPNHLKLSGLVKAENGLLQVRNEIYRRAFDLDWVKENTPFNWTLVLAGIAGILGVVAVLAVGFIVYNGWVDMQVHKAVDSFYQTNAPEKQLEHLAKIFTSRPLLGSTDYDYRARELFFGLSRDEQLTLFNGYNLKEPDLIVVVRGLYGTLADVDGTNSTGPLLEAMASALGRLDETEKTIRLRDEINSWLQGRVRAGQNQYGNALDEYTRAIALNGENPATRYERARILIELEGYREALSDLDQVMAIARNVTEPTATPPQPTVAPAATSTASAEPSLTQTSSPSRDISLTETPRASVTAIPKTSPTPTPTPATVSFASEFANSGQIRSAVRNLIYSKRALIAALISPSSSEHPNLLALMPYLRVSAGQLNVYAAPGENYEVLGQVRRGYQLLLLGRLEDGTWWQVDYLGWAGWIPAWFGEASINPDDLPVVTAPALPTVIPTPIQETVLGYSVKNREISMTVIGDGIERAVVIIGAMDGIQTNTRDLVNAMVSYFDANPQEVPGHITFYFVPSINPDGVVTNNRYNANDVDINRNWDTADWTQNPGEPGYPEGKPGAGGSRPFSEPETQALRDLLQRLKRQEGDVLVVSLHSSVVLSQGNGQVFPGSTTSGLHDGSIDAAERFAGEMKYSVETEWDDYTTTGALITWCAEQDIVSIDVVFSKSDVVSLLRADFVRALLEVIHWATRISPWMTISRSNIPYDFADAYRDLALDQLEEHAEAIESEVRRMLQGDWAPEMLGIEEPLMEVWIALGL